MEPNTIGQPPRLLDDAEADVGDALAVDHARALERRARRVEVAEEAGPVAEHDVRRVPSRRGNP